MTSTDRTSGRIDDQTDAGIDGDLDRIERSIDIDASAERVYALIARPGWWINKQEVDPEPDLRREGDLHVLTHPEYGEFRLEVLEEEPPRYVSFRWLDNVAPEAGTLVEFWVEDRSDGGVTLRVVESGFSGLKKDRASILHQIEENTHGWKVELDAARRFVTGAEA